MRICAHPCCETPVKGQRDKRYCSDSCRALASRLNRLHKKLRNLGLPLHKKCEKCGSRFLRESEVQRRCNTNRPVASAACRDAEAERVAVKADGGPKYTITCADPKCGKVVSFPCARGRRRIFCTEACWSRVYRQRNAPVKESKNV